MLDKLKPELLHQVRLSLIVRIKHFKKQTEMYPYFKGMTRNEYKRSRYILNSYLGSIYSYNLLFPDEEIDVPTIPYMEHVEGQTFMCPA